MHVGLVVGDISVHSHGGGDDDCDYQGVEGSFPP